MIFYVFKMVVTIAFLWENVVEAIQAEIHRNKMNFKETQYTANIFKVIFTVFNCVRLSTVVSLYGLHLIAAPSTIK